MYEADWVYASRLTVVGAGFQARLETDSSYLPEINRSIAYALGLSYTPRNLIIHALIIKMFCGITFCGLLER